nr:MAG TPA: hypothetical protein [Caudoviricetes sp.]DAI74329.1 MAG TPA: hypothetical protein [Caudoviricetes sp.]DAW49993.1 MAG TPA: hypothetical protein [Caudoviricetes sp.]
MHIYLLTYNAHNVIVISRYQTSDITLMIS